MSRTVKQEKPRLETVGYADLGSQDTEVKASRTTPSATTTSSFPSQRKTKLNT